MPYKTKTGRLQSARSTGHVSIIQNELVKQRLENFRLFTPSPVTSLDPGLLFQATALGDPLGDIRWVMSFDGSPHEVAAREEYPSTRLCFVQIAGVLVDLEQMLRQQHSHLVDPLVIKNASDEALYSLALPGSNVCRKDMPTVRDSWRADIYEIFRDYIVEAESLLTFFMSLVAESDKVSASGGVVLSRCSASEVCNARDIEVPASGCNCPSCGGQLFPTDALRIYEEVSEEHSNITALGRLMSALEHIILAAYVSVVFDRQPRALGRMAFILDGPLALFGPQAWLHSAMRNVIAVINEKLERQGLIRPVIVGIEKGGQFAEHAEAIADKCVEGQLMALPDKYIYEHILSFRDPIGRSFGRDTYYGQKFFYKSQQGNMLTITIPKLSSTVADPHSPGHYSLLPDTLALLDKIGTSLYQDALIPVALAHSFAAIPVRTGSKVLTILSREVLGL